MAYIYKIVNSVNGKVYVGQTKRSIQSRFKQHIQDSRRNFNFKSKLYDAMRKYGEDNFCIVEIEECDEAVLDDRERFWIKELDSIKSGYNISPGGIGGVPSDKSDILPMWEDGCIITEIVKATGHAQETVIDYLLSIGVEKSEMRQRARESMANKTKRRIYQYDLDGNYVGTYASIWDAEKETGINHGCINGVLCGHHYSAGQYQWSKTKVDNIGKCPHRVCWTQKSVYQYDLNGNLVGTYQSLQKAAKSVGFKTSNSIRNVCIGRKRSAAGFIWSYDMIDAGATQRKDQRASRCTA